mgnify:FL=1
MRNCKYATGDLPAPGSAGWPRGVSAGARRVYSESLPLSDSPASDDSDPDWESESLSPMARPSADMRLTILSSGLHFPEVLLECMVSSSSSIPRAVQYLHGWLTLIRSRPVSSLNKRNAPMRTNTCLNFEFLLFSPLSWWLVCRFRNRLSTLFMCSVTWFDDRPNGIPPVSSLQAAMSFDKCSAR